jgi:hypothetical protein
VIDQGGRISPERVHEPDHPRVDSGAVLAHAQSDEVLVSRVPQGSERLFVIETEPRESR